MSSDEIGTFSFSHFLHRFHMCDPLCVLSVVSDSFNPMDCNPPGPSVHEISRQEYWSRLPFPPPKDLPDPEIEP